MEQHLKIWEQAAAYLRGDEAAGEWLKQIGMHELFHFIDAIEHVELSFKWLRDNGHNELAATVDAVHGNANAKVWLMKQGFPMLSAFADACDGNKTAVAYLLKNNERGWLLIAKEVALKEKKKDKGFLGGLLNLGNPYA